MAAVVAGTLGMAGLSGKRSSVLATAVAVEESLDVRKVEPVVAPFADSVSFERPDFAPQPDCIGMDMEQMGHLVDRQHPAGRNIIFMRIHQHGAALNKTAISSLSLTLRHFSHNTDSPERTYMAAPKKT